MKQSQIIFNWAQALFELIKAEKSDRYYITEINLLIEALRPHYDFINIMNARWIKRSQKEAIVTAIIPDKKLSYLKRALLILASRSEAHFYLHILQELRVLIDKYHNITYAQVFSCVLLTDSQITKLQNKLSKKFNTQIKCINHIDKSLIGGVKVKFQNQVLDGSFLTKITKIKQKVFEYSKFK